MGRRKRSRSTESESSRKSESSGRSQRETTRRATKVNYVHVEVLRSSGSSESSRRNHTPPPKKVTNISVGISGKRSAAKRSSRSDQSSTQPPSKFKDVNVAVSGKKTSEGAGSSVQDSSTLSTDVNAEVCTKKTAQSTGSSARDASSASTNVNVEVSGKKTTNSVESNSQAFDSSSTNVNVEVSGRTADMSGSSSDPQSAASHKNVKDVGVQAPAGKALTTTPSMASVKVSKPVLQITLHKPPSLWSRLWNGLSKLKASKISWRHGVLEGLKAAVNDSTDLLVARPELALLDDEPIEEGSPTLLETCDTSRSSEENGSSNVNSDEDSQEPAIKKRKILTTESKNQFEAACSLEEPQRTTRHIELEWQSQANLLTPQIAGKSTAVAHISVNSNKQLKYRSYAVCKHLREATNDIGLIIFCSYPEDQTLCLSVYGLSFIITLTKHYVKDTKAILRETLRCGAMVLQDDGRMADSCKEVVTTLRRRLAETDEASVITETYLRRCGATNMESGCGMASSTKNTSSHILSADLKTAMEYPAKEVWKELLFNTACFENIWRCPFNKQSTYMGSFLNNWTKKVAVPLMCNTLVLPYSFYPDRQVDVVCLPYADDAVCMTLIVQRSSSSGSLSVLTPEDVMGFVRGARNTLLTLHLPKFRVSTPLDVTRVMNRIACADSEEQRMRFLHAELETSIAVDEGNCLVNRTERSSTARDTVTVVVDRPFHFVITDRTSDLILYVGRVMSFA